MIASLAVTAGLLLHAAGNRHPGSAAPRGGYPWNSTVAWMRGPTAAKPCAELLDTARRVAAGGPSHSAGVTYSRGAPAVARGRAAPPQVCLGCVRRAPPVVAVA